MKSSSGFPCYESDARHVKGMPFLAITSVAKAGMVALVALCAALAIALLLSPSAAHAEGDLLTAKTNTQAAGSLSAKSIVLFPGANTTIQITRTAPKTVSGTAELLEPSYVYKSANTAIATVSSSGVVKGVKPGKTSIVVTDAANGLATKAIVTVKKTKIARKGSSDIRISAYGSKKLRVKNLAGKPKITWKSSNKKVATVTSDGKVEGGELGVTVITAKAANGNSIKWSVQVNSSNFIMKEGKTMTLASIAKTVKGYKFNKAKWKSSKKSVVAIVGKKAKGLKYGKSKLTFKVGKRKYTANVWVDCKHRFKLNTAYNTYCENMANHYEDEAERWERAAYYASNASDEMEYLAKATLARYEYADWARWSLKTWYKCSKCGKRKAV